MNDEPVDDTVRFTEAGITFEIFGRDILDERLIAVSGTGGEVDGFKARDWPEACRIVDDYLDGHLAAGAPGRFGGFRLRMLMHEGGVEEERSYLSRGQILGQFEDGAMPDIESLIDLAECAGDKVLEVRDGAGALLFERRDAPGMAYPSRP